MFEDETHLLKELQHGLVVHEHFGNRSVKPALSGWKFCAVGVAMEDSKKADHNFSNNKFQPYWASRVAARNGYDRDAPGLRFPARRQGRR